MQDFNNKVIAITGGATGIGFALAKAFGADGAKIVIGEPRPEKLDKAVVELSSLGIEAAATRLDVTDPDSMTAFADFAWERFGKVHGLVNNAGVGGGGLRSMTKIPLDDLHALMNVNFFGVWHGTAEFGRRFVAQGEEAMILNVGSENSFFNAMPKMAAYIASKHAVRGMTEAMREEFPDFIQIGLICPGLVQSDMTANMGNLGMPADEFAERILKQVKAGAFYLVGHAYNIERIKPIHAEIEAAYATHVPRYDGDEKYDVRLLVEKMQGR